MKAYFFDELEKAHFSYKNPKTLFNFFEKETDSLLDGNFKLLYENSLFNSLKNKEIYLLHFTGFFDSLIKSKKLFGSSGCLIGGIYCTPLINTDNGLRLHNLGEYIFRKESLFMKKIKI